MIDTAADLPVFLSSADFGVAATLGATPVVGLLDETPAIAFGEIVGGTDPRFILAASSLPADPRIVQLTVGARTFNVRDWNTDGTGLATLQLEAA